MSTEQQWKRWSSGVFAYVAGCVILSLLSAVVIYALSSGRGRSTRPGSRLAQRPEEPLEHAREALSRSTDLNVCRQVVQQMNEYLGHSSGPQLPALTAAQRALLEKEFQLDADQLAEVERGSFTPLDAHHLDLCFLARDALRAIQGQDGPARPPRSAEQVAAAFAWVVRQVQLGEETSEPIPPQFILRRGHGGILERSLIFLALLQQMGVPGCLVAVPSERGPRLWACGAVLEQGEAGQVLLFDPRLGLPLPGPKGQGSATLAETQAQPELLEQLTVDGKYPYDVTAEQAGKAEVHVVCTLSALAPRMSYLEKSLQAPAIKAPPVVVNLAADAPALLAQLRGAAGKDTPVKAAAALTGVLRRFLPADEGGVDRSDLLNRFKVAMIPWDSLPGPIRGLPGDPGQRLQSLFGEPFLRLALEPRLARDRVLRGQFAEAAGDLVQALDELRGQKGLKEKVPADWPQQLEGWRQEINRAQADLIKVQRTAGGAGTPAVEEAKARVIQVWQGGSQLLVPLVLSHAAEPRQLRLDHLLALCKHEEAEQLQARVDRLPKPDAKDRAEARRAWKDAAQSWESFAAVHPSAREAAVTRRLHARARIMLDERERAAALLEDLSGPLTDLEKTAHLYLARQLRRPQTEDRE